MVRCPFCQYDNEEGALFCEQCKSDLGGVESTPVARAEPAHEGEEDIPVAAGVEDEGLPLDQVPEAEPMVAEAVPVEASPFGEGGFGDHDRGEASPVAEAGLAGPDEGTPWAPEPPPAEEAPEAYPAAEAPPAEEAAPVAEAVPVTPEPPPPPAAEKAPEPAPTPTAPPAPQAAPAAAAAAAVAAPAPPAPAADGGQLPPDAQPRLVVLRGLKVNVEYPLYEGHNFIGRADEKPVDIDLEDQEPPDRIWSSRQHAFINYEEGRLTIEDLNSSNGTFVNRQRIYPGQKRPLQVNDVIQIGTVQMKVKA